MRRLRARNTRTAALLSLTALSSGAVAAQVGDPPSCSTPVPGPIDVTSVGYCADPGEGTPGDQDGIAIRKAIQDAAAGMGGGVVYFPPGIYEIGDDPSISHGSQKSGIFMNQLANVTLQGPASGVAELRFQDRNGRGFHLKQCSGIQLMDLTLRYEDPTHLEGTIVAYSSSEEHPDVPGLFVPRYTVELAPYFQPLTGDPFLFATELIDWSLHAYDPVTRRHKRYSSMMDADAVEVAGTSVHLYMDTNGGQTPASTFDPLAMNIDVGSDLAAITIERQFDSSAGILTGNFFYSRFSSNLLFEDLVMLNSPFFAAQHDFDSNVTYRRCSIVPDPDLEADPAKGVLGALVSTNRDGLRFISSRGGPQIVDCVFERNGDDPINIRGNWLMLVDLQVDAGGAYQMMHLQHLANPTSTIDVRNGDTLEVLHPVHLDQKSSTTVDPDPQYGPFPDPSGGLWVRTTSVAQAWVGDLVVVPETQSNGFVVRGNTVRETRARGIYARGVGGLIEDNVVAGTVLGGIVCSPDLSPFFKESSFNTGLDVWNNTIHNTGFKRWHASPSSCDLGALTVGVRHSQSAWPIGVENETIDVRGNWISTSRFASLFLGSVNGATVEDNHLLDGQLDPDPVAGSGAGIEPLGAAMGLFHLQNGLGVTHGGNVLDTAFLSSSPLVAVTASTAPSTFYGVPVNDDITPTGGGDDVQVFATSFEMEEGWLPTEFGSGDPSSSSLYNHAGTWSATIDGVPFTFVNWGLFGNHHAWHHYRGFISSRTQKKDGSMEIDLSAAPSSPTKIELWAAANTPPGGTANYTFEVQYKPSTGGRWLVLDVIDPVTLPYPPSFQHLEYDALPPDVAKLRLLRKGGTDDSLPFLYVDDVVVRYD